MTVIFFVNLGTTSVTSSQLLYIPYITRHNFKIYIRICQCNVITHVYVAMCMFRILYYAIITCQINRNKYFTLRMSSREAYSTGYTVYIKLKI
jgi:hypothetical protein